MTNEEIKQSLAKQVAEPISNPVIEIEVTEMVSTIKKYSANELPLYFKWDLGENPWYYRVRHKNGRTVCDLLKEYNNEIQHSYTTVTQCFHKDNKPVSEDTWRNLMHNFIKQLS